MLKRIYPYVKKLGSSGSLTAYNLPKYAFATNEIKEKIKAERIERLKSQGEYFPTRSFDDLSLIRNLGIIAHIDAGKTTTTERMLYYAGALNIPGETHEGTTVMDYMDQERDRGITIRAAAITFTWDKHQFNLIDTPGHIDFNAEVERSLRALDGAIAIFDAVSGVQTQSEIVWLQANKFHVPKIAFVNKMDLSGASLENCVESMKYRLNVHPFVVQLPIGSADTFTGVIDLIYMQKITWTDDLGKDLAMEDISPDDPLYSKAKDERDKLISEVANFNERIAEDFLEGKEIGPARLEESIRGIVQRRPSDTCVVYVGSSLKNRGIQPLMDGVVKYLPSPSERDPVAGKDLVNNRNALRYPRKNDKLCALAFKVIHDQQKGALVYVRIYSGTLNNKTNLFNVTRDSLEKSIQIYRVRADHYVPVSDLHAGDILAIAGLKNTYTGDTLIEPKDDERITLQGVEVPPPVFIASLEYNSVNDKAAFDHACQILTREDPSLEVKENEETGQTLVYGLGELHLEVFRDRLKTEFGVETRFGKMKVSYRESITDVSQMSAKISKAIYGKPSFANLELKIEPANAEDLQYLTESPDTSKRIVMGSNVLVFDCGQGPDFMRLYNEFKRRLRRKKAAPAEERQEVHKLELQQHNELANLKLIRNEPHGHPIDEYTDEFGTDTIYELKSAPFELFHSIESAIENALTHGPLLGAPLINTKITLVRGSYSMERSNDVVFQMCAATLIPDLLKVANPAVMEPIVDMEISTPTSELNHVLNDILSNRRGQVVDVVEEKSHFGNAGLQRTTIYVTVPLQETVGYAGYLRSVTKGEAHFIMKFREFADVGVMKQKEILANYS